MARISGETYLWTYDNIIMKLEGIYLESTLSVAKEKTRVLSVLVCLKLKDR